MTVESRGDWRLTASTNGVIIASSPTFGFSDGSQNLPFGERINQITIGNWFSNGVGFDIDNIVLVAPEPSALMLLGGVAICCDDDQNRRLCGVRNVTKHV